MSVNAGTKRVCPPTDLAGVPEGGEPKKRADCATRHGVSNLNFPRTDPTVIMAIVSSDGTKLLLGRGKRYPPGWYSTLAGFLEPGESIEEAVRRETWEESGVHVGRVVIHSSQPWPVSNSQNHFLLVMVTFRARDYLIRPRQCLEASETLANTAQKW